MRFFNKQRGAPAHAATIRMVVGLLSVTLLAAASPAAATGAVRLTTAGAHKAAGGQQQHHNAHAGAKSAVAASRPPPQPFVAFQGSALLIFYYSGVVESLLKCGAILPGVTRMGGLSGGAATAALTAIGLSGEQQRQFWLHTIQGCATRYDGACAGRLNALYKAALQDVFKQTDVQKVNGKVTVWLSQLDGRKTTLNNTASWGVSSWANKADLASCLTSTDYIPCFSGPDTFTYYRNEPVIDGGYANGFEELCSTSHGASCLKVGSYVVGTKASHSCSATACPTAAADKCSEAGRTDRVKKLYQNEKYTSSNKIESVRLRCPSAAWATRDPYPLPAFVPQGSVTPDIHPGKFGPLPAPSWNGNKPLLACQWQGLAMSLPKGHELEATTVQYELGKADAAAWCRQHNYPVAA